MNPDHAPLFRPFRFKELQLSNRLVMAPMSRYHCPDNIPHQENIDYYRRRAEGGVGLLISEGTFIAHPSATGYENVPHFCGKEALAGWREVVAAVHDAGAAFFPQLWHAGSWRQPGMSPDPQVPGFSPSGVINGVAENKVPPKAMNEQDIAEVIAGFAESAAAAREIGCDGLEIHGAHGYLIDEFFWPETNHRNDRYGGSLENRLRLAVEIITAVRRAVGADFPLCFRFSQWKQQNFEARLAQSPDELEALLRPLVDAGVDIFHASSRRYWEPEFTDSPLNLAGWTKKLTDKPVITVGSVGLDSRSFNKANASSVAPVAERLERGEFDLVAVGRALLSEPAWANKLHNGQEAEIAPFSGADIVNYR